MENDKFIIEYFAEENKIVQELFDLNEILDFQLKHDVQIIRGEDYQYLCYIDKKGLGVSLTPMCALVIGIKEFKEFEEKTKK
jgi:hypothetical protein